MPKAHRRDASSVWKDSEQCAEVRRADRAFFRCAANRCGSILFSSPGNEAKETCAKSIISTNIRYLHIIDSYRYDIMTYKNPYHMKYMYHEQTSYQNSFVTKSTSWIQKYKATGMMWHHFSPYISINLCCVRGTQGSDIILQISSNQVPPGQHQGHPMRIGRWGKGKLGNLNG